MAVDNNVKGRKETRRDCAVGRDIPACRLQQAGSVNSQRGVVQGDKSDVSRLIIRAARYIDFAK